jgi:putative flippase GtrA
VTGLLQQFTRFLIGGLANTGGTYVLFVLLVSWMHPQIAYTLVFIVGIALSYAINTLFVFRSGMSLGSVLRFPVVYAVQYVAGLVLLTVLINVGFDSRLAMIVVIALAVPLSFVLIRLALHRSAP